MPKLCLQIIGETHIPHGNSPLPWQHKPLNCLSPKNVYRLSTVMCVVTKYSLDIQKFYQQLLSRTVKCYSENKVRNQEIYSLLIVSKPLNLFKIKTTLLSLILFFPLHDSFVHIASKYP